MLLSYRKYRKAVKPYSYFTCSIRFLSMQCDLYQQNTRDNTHSLTFHVRLPDLPAYSLCLLHGGVTCCCGVYTLYTTPTNTQSTLTEQHAHAFTTRSGDRRLCPRLPPTPVRSALCAFCCPRRCTNNKLYTLPMRCIRRV